MRFRARESRRLILWAAALAVLVSPSPALAHHGKGFLLVESDEMPHKREVYFFSSQDFVHRDEEDEYELSPALLFGLSDRVAIEVHSHFEKAEGESLRYEAFAPSLRVGLTDPESDAPLKLGLAAEYEIARGDAEDRFETRLIAAYRTSDVNLTANLIAERITGEDGEWEWGYAAGLRPWPERRFGVGLEALGTLSGPSSHEILGGLYFTEERFTLKLGVGTGFGEEGPELTIRTGFVFRF